MQSADEYAGWAARYQRFYKEDPDIVEFFRELIGRYSIRKFLDCACGPGDELLMLHSLGCDVTGSDISPAMLQLAKENVDEAGIDIPLHEVDFRQLPGHFSDAFDAVICWSGSIFQIADDGEVLRGGCFQEYVGCPIGARNRDPRSRDNRLSLEREEEVPSEQIRS